jgi:hypothetical protein
MIVAGSNRTTSAAAAGGVDRREQAIGLAPAVGPAELHVGDLDMDAAMLADVDRLGAGLVHGMGFVADMGRNSGRRRLSARGRGRAARRAR